MKCLLFILGLSLTVSVGHSYGQTVLANDDGQLYNPNKPTRLTMGTGGAGKTFGVLGTSQDAGGYFNIQSVRSSGNFYGDIILNSAGGNVGVGTTSPNALFHVNGTLLTSGNPANIDPNPSNTRGNLSYMAQTGAMLVGWNRSASGGETSFISNQGSGGSGGFAFYNHDNSNAETQLMWIRGDGNVGIGTSDPHGYKLAVNGTIRSKEVKVEAGLWPDYVFEPAYKLRPIKEVEVYISQNGHLPEVPSAEEVTKEGINLGELNTKLFKKVEELTLYIIEQNHRIEKMERMLAKKK